MVIPFKGVGINDAYHIGTLRDHPDMRGKCRMESMLGRVLV